jgi:hypothetical protein
MVKLQTSTWLIKSKSRPDFGPIRADPVNHAGAGPLILHRSIENPCSGSSENHGEAAPAPDAWTAWTLWTAIPYSPGMYLQRYKFSHGSLGRACPWCPPVHGQAEQARPRGFRETPLSLIAPAPGDDAEEDIGERRAKQVRDDGLYHRNASRMACTSADGGLNAD